MTLTITPTFELPLGTSPTGEPVSLDLDSNPNTLVVGGTGTGKANLLRHLVTGSLAAGAKTTVIDPIRHGLGFRELADVDLVTNGAAAISALEGIVAEVARRGELLDEFGAGKWQELPQEVRDAKDVRPIVLVINEYAALVTQGNLSKIADLESDWYIEATQRNAEAERSEYLVRKILLTARYSGVHLVVVTQRPDSLLVGRAPNGDLDNVILMLHPSRKPGNEYVRMTFGADGFEAAAAAIGDADSAPGDAVIASTTGGVQRFHVLYGE